MLTKYCDDIFNQDVLFYKYIHVYLFFALTLILLDIIIIIIIIKCQAIQTDSFIKYGHIGFYRIHGETLDNNKQIPPFYSLTKPIMSQTNAFVKSVPTTQSQSVGSFQRAVEGVR